MESKHTHLLKQVNELLLSYTAPQLPCLCHPQQNGLDLPCTVLTDKRNTSYYNRAQLSEPMSCHRRELIL